MPIGYAGLIERMLDKEITFEEMDREYRKMARQNTDWFKLLFRNSFSHKHALSISGGSEKIMNRTSFNVDQQMGEAKGNDLSNIGMISSTEIHIGKNFVMNWSLNGSMRKVESFAYGVDPFTYAYETTRVIPAYNEDGTLYYHDKWGAGSFAVNDKNNYNYNILNELSNTGARTESRNWGTTLDVSWELFPGLQYQGVFSYNSSSSDVKQYATERSFYITQYRGYEYGTALPNSQEERSARIPYGGVLETGTTTVESVTVRNSLNYSKLLRDKHFVVFATGVETNSTKTTGGTNLKYGYLKDRGETFVNIPFMIYYGMDMENSEYAYGKTTVLNRKNNLLSVYAQGVYSYDDRYVVNVSARVDASNRFGQDKNRRFAPTWSAGVKWSVGNESFLKGSLWFNLLDITLSYGYQGNAVESVSPYLIARDGGIDASYSSYILKIKSLPYPNLGWEKTKSYNLGIDASFLDGRLNFGFNYYEKDSDVLSSRDIPHENGMAHSVVSGSKMKNTGFDFTVEVIPVRTDQFSWHLSVNSGATKNNVRRNDRINTLEDFLSGSAVVEGEPFSTFYSFQFKELDQKDGTPLFNKLDQTQVSSPVEYLVKSGKFTPDFSGGLNTMFKYRNWNLSAFFAMQWGGSGRLPELYRTEYNNGVPTPEQNVSRKLQRRWRKPGDQTIYPSIPGVGRAKKMSLPQEQTVWSTPIRSPYKMYNESDIRVAKTDMIRCTSISLGYEFNPEILRKLYIGRLSLIASMQNPFMWVRDKKWEGIDPETGNWPARRVTSLSLQVAF
ncbi:TonB-dependent receptor domain-containing protein [Gabonibacter massiliensis]|uniref:TonB-dependent receptor domain-containing protein n=1 Tax=Gabonibacter massiliensis TaxID=1720195 RepID=UPI002570399E|nr:TonB-dependent receptor [Gabonibacter massiliensis]